MHSGMLLSSASLWFNASSDSVATVNPQLTLFSINSFIEEEARGFVSAMCSHSSRLMAYLICFQSIRLHEQN